MSTSIMEDDERELLVYINSVYVYINIYICISMYTKFFMDII